MASTRRTARLVPEGIVTFCGGGGGGGGAGEAGADGAGAMEAIGAEELSLPEEEDGLRSREARRRGLDAGAGSRDGLGCSAGAAAAGVVFCAVSAGGALTCRLLIT